MRYLTATTTNSPLRLGLLAIAVALVAAFAAPQAAQAQARWLQTVQIIVPVEQEKATGALLDTLAASMERGDELPLFRTPEKQGAVSFAELQNSLLNEGLDVTSANNVFVTYRFEADRQGFKETIENLFFIYRPEGMEDTDIPVFYVDATDPAVKKLFMDSGTTLRINEAAFHPFREQLQFAALMSEYGGQADQMLVTVGDRVIRDEGEAQEERRRLIATIRRFSY